MVLVVASFFVAGFLPVVAVATVLAGLRLWRLLLTLAAICALVFGALFLAAAIPVSQREPNLANTEPALSLAGTLLYAAVIGVIV